jgi:hypothetical protein
MHNPFLGMNLFFFLCVPNLVFGATSYASFKWFSDHLLPILDSIRHKNKVNKVVIYILTAFFFLLLQIFLFNLHLSSSVFIFIYMIQWRSSITLELPLSFLYEVLT